MNVNAINIRMRRASGAIASPVFVLLTSTSSCAWAMHSSELCDFDSNCSVSSFLLLQAYTTPHSPVALSAAGWNGAFLGPLGDEALSIGVLDPLPSPDAGTHLLISFDLILREGTPHDNPGAERFLSLFTNRYVDGDLVRLSETSFSFGPNPAAFQSFPGEYPSARFAAGSESVYHNLSYEDVSSYPGDLIYESAYRVRYLFPISAVLDGYGCCFNLRLAGSGFGGGATWGVDNFLLDWSVVAPLPSAVWLLASGLGFIFAMQKLRRGRIPRRD